MSYFFSVPVLTPSICICSNADDPGVAGDYVVATRFVVGGVRQVWTLLPDFVAFVRQVWPKVTRSHPVRHRRHSFCLWT